MNDDMPDDPYADDQLPPVKVAVRYNDEELGELTFDGELWRRADGTPITDIVDQTRLWLVLRLDETARAESDLIQATERAEREVASGAGPTVIAAALDQVEASQRALYELLDRPAPGTA